MILRKVAFAATLVVSAGAACAAEIDIVNSSGKAIVELYVVPAGQKDWGPDRLAGMQPKSIANGTSRTIPDLAPGTYDLLLVEESGAECEFKAVAIDQTYRIALTPAQLRACTQSH